MLFVVALLCVGSDRIFLPGSIDVPPNSLLNQQLLESPPKRTTSFNPPRGSGRSFYTQADLLAVTIRISSDIVQKELELVRQESVVERQERERLLVWLRIAVYISNATVHFSVP